MSKWLWGLLYILNSKSLLLIVVVLNLVASVSHVVAESEYSKQQVSQYQKAIQALHAIPFETLSVDSVPFCMRYTCREMKSIQIPSLAWEQATQVLSKRPNSAKMERALLSEVVSRIELLMGRVTNTQYDIGGTFRVNSEPSVNSMQLDCVDEAFNMSVYLHLLNNEGKLHWHRIGGVVHRGWLVDLSYPHTALSIVEQNTDKKFVIDSWFHDNGRPPELLSLQLWKAGWLPEDFR